MRVNPSSISCKGDWEFQKTNFFHFLLLWPSSVNKGVSINLQSKLSILIHLYHENRSLRSWSFCMHACTRGTTNEKTFMWKEVKDQDNFSRFCRFFTLNINIHTYICICVCGCVCVYAYERDQVSGLEHTFVKFIFCLSTSNNLNAKQAAGKKAGLRCNIIFLGSLFFTCCMYF